MQTKTQTTKNISKTAYRAILLLKNLIITDLCKSEIIDIFRKDPILNTNISSDTIMLTINILRKIGCEIPKPNAKNNYKYHLVSHPFGMKLEQKFINALNMVRKNIFEKNDIELIFKINSLYSKFERYTNCGNQKLQKGNPINKVDDDIFLKLYDCAQNKNIINFLYSSQRLGARTVVLHTDKLSYENGHLYIWGLNEETEKYEYFRAERIIKIIKEISAKKNKLNTKTITAKYILNDESVVYFKNKLLKLTNLDIRITKEDDNCLEVEEIVRNEFNFIQKILSFGEDVELLAPQSLKNTLIEKLKKIRGYYDE